MPHPTTSPGTPPTASDYRDHPALRIVARKGSLDHSLRKSWKSRYANSPARFNAVRYALASDTSVATRSPYQRRCRQARVTFHTFAHAPERARKDARLLRGRVSPALERRTHERILTDGGHPAETPIHKQDRLPGTKSSKTREPDTSPEGPAGVGRRRNHRQSRPEPATKSLQPEGGAVEGGVDDTREKVCRHAHEPVQDTDGQPPAAGRSCRGAGLRPRRHASDERTRRDRLPQPGGRRTRPAGGCGAWRGGDRFPAGRVEERRPHGTSVPDSSHHLDRRGRNPCGGRPQRQPGRRGLRRRVERHHPQPRHAPGDRGRRGGAERGSHRARGAGGASAGRRGAGVDAVVLGRRQLGGDVREHQERRRERGGRGRPDVHRGGGRSPGDRTARRNSRTPARRSVPSAT